MGKLRDMLMSEREALLRSYRPLEDEIKAMRFEIYEKQQRMARMAGEIEKINLALKALEDTDDEKTPTIMQAVMEVLHDRPEGMTANEILAEINVRYFGGRISRSSLSPQLSRLKDRDALIELKGNKWFRLPDEPAPPLIRRKL